MATSSTYHSGVHIYLPMSFSNTVYQITVGLATKNNDGTIDFQDVGYGTKTETSFAMRTENTKFLYGSSWLAIGY